MKTSHKKLRRSNHAMWIKGACAGMMLATLLVAQDAPTGHVTYKGEIRALVKKRCVKCHNLDRSEADLDLSSLEGILTGSYSGEVAIKGKPMESLLHLTANHLEEPFMPPKRAKLPSRELQMLQRWIELGMPNEKSDIVVMPIDRAMPTVEGSSPESARSVSESNTGLPNTITAMAVHPSEPILAVAAHREILLINPVTRETITSLPYPEGEAFSLNFTSDGMHLVAGGGTHVENGQVVVWDHMSRQRAVVVGDEYDTVLAADLTADRQIIALGGPSKVIKGYRVQDSELIYRGTKHTDWVTALSFSPDDLLLASGDRTGNLFVWEAVSGQPFATLRGHQGGITGLAWSTNSEQIVSISEDGIAIRWDLHNQKEVQRWKLHSEGVLSISQLPDGRYATTGRDRIARLWTESFQVITEFGPFDDLPLENAVIPQRQLLCIGDWKGNVEIWDIKSGENLGSLPLNRNGTALREDTLIIVEDSMRVFHEAANERNHPTAPLLSSTFEQRRQELSEVLENLTRADKILDTASSLRSELEATQNEIAKLQTEATSRQHARESRNKLIRHLASAQALAQQTDSEHSETDELQLLIKLALERANQMSTWEDRSAREATELAKREAKLKARLQETANDLSTLLAVSDLASELLTSLCEELATADLDIASTPRTSPETLSTSTVND